MGIERRRRCNDKSISMNISTTTINETYEACRCRRHDKQTEAVAVPPFLATSHAFNLRKLERKSSFVVCALKKLPKTLRRSNGCTGQPWIVARHIHSQEKDYSLDVIDRLLSMAVGLGMVTATIPEGAPSDMKYITIEDERIIRQCRQNRDYRGAKWGD